MEVEKLVNLLIERRLHITSAESLTGGLFSATLVGVPNASKVLDMAFVTYAEKAKVNLLGVSSLTITQFGVVSQEVALAMALGAQARSKADIAVSFTGLAGPSGDGFNEVGTTWMGIFYKGQSAAFKKIFKGDRNEIRMQAVQYMIDKLINIIENDTLF